ncbi:MAG: transposase [Chloroflexi bacterium]|nr:transposase [Chloroflexota bacterium]
MTLFRNKYRIESTRLRNWDYAGAGWYFVTLCTRNRELFFGDVKEGEMILSPVGEIIAEEWLKTKEVRVNVELDEWIVMPNHVHGIIVITHPVETSRRDVSENVNHQESVSAKKNTTHGETPHRVVSTKGRLKANSLGSIIGQLKSVCTKRIWAAGFRHFDWQPRFHDEIIRDQPHLDYVRQYIKNNPAKWELDKDNPANLRM